MATVNVCDPTTPSWEMAPLGFAAGWRTTSVVGMVGVRVTPHLMTCHWGCQVG